MFARLLVPLDGSTEAAAALAPARALADEHDADLVLVRVVESDLALPGDELSARAATYLAAIVVAQGDPAAEIVREARASDASLVVMGVGGGAGPASTGRGGVADAVVRSAPCPVFLSRSARDGVVRLAAAALDQPAAWNAGEGAPRTRPASAPAAAAGVRGLIAAG